MAYRNGTYVAFDGEGEQNPTKGDLRYLGVLRAWQKNDNIDFNYVDSHKKTYQVRDTSSEATLKARLRERMANSKNMLVVVSPDTNYDRGLLNWEVETAVKDYNLPVIVAYTGYQKIGIVDKTMVERMPKFVYTEYKKNTGKLCHVAFTKDEVKKAIAKYSVVGNTYPASNVETI